VTLTVLLDGPTPSADAFVLALFGTSIESRPDTFFPAGKASLSGAEKVGLSGFDDAASRAYQAERGFVGQAPKERWIAQVQTAGRFRPLTEEEQLAQRVGVDIGKASQKVRVLGKVREIDVYDPGNVIGETTTSARPLERPLSWLSEEEKGIQARMYLAHKTGSQLVYEFKAGVDIEVVGQLNEWADMWRVPI